MRKVRLAWVFAILSGLLYAEDIQKHSLKCNMTHLYDELPDEVSSIGEMFSEGIFYGRLRFNSFGFKWKEEVEVGGTKVRTDQVVGAVGGSLIYKSATWNGLSAAAGFYATHSLGNLDKQESYLYKAGKDTFSRYDALTDGSLDLVSLAQGYIQYTYKDTFVKVGRQIVESFLTKSNDTKMIPNTFEGVTLRSGSIYDTSFLMAYLTRQKLRDHADFHHLLAYGDNPDDPYASFTENDDSAMHRGLKLSELQARGIDDRLIIAEAKNESIANLALKANYTAVPELISSAMIQADYMLDIGDMYIIPGFRYMKQFDDGAGEIGGANLKTLTDGYFDPESLNSELFGARLAFVQDGLKFRLGYTKVADKGDIIAPWRGFPTAGFTRAMAQYNWYANTESYMIQVDYELEAFEEFKIISRFAVQDFDDSKIGVQADSNIFEINFFKGLGESPMYLKTRFAHVAGDNDTVVNGITKPDPSYNELRIEVNYLF